MPQRYRVRLGDGTIVAVAPDGLETWAEDHRAMAQAVGTQHWRPLQDVLAEEQAAARLARALVPPTPRQKATATPPPAPALPPLEFPEFDLGVEPPVVAPRPPRPSLQVLADDPVSSRPFADAPRRTGRGGVRRPADHPAEAARRRAGVPVRVVREPGRGRVRRGRAAARPPRWSATDGARDGGRFPEPLPGSPEAMGGPADRGSRARRRGRPRRRTAVALRARFRLGGRSARSPPSPGARGAAGAEA